MSILRSMMRPIMRPMIRPVFRGSAFDPLSLFANGEQGAWYDPSDLTTLYQDSAGTTPVAADGDPVGLMLDKSRGLALGPELVANGGPFMDTSGWTVSNGVLEVVNGRLRLTATGAPGVDAIAVPATPVTMAAGSYRITGKTYLGNGSNRIIIGNYLTPLSEASHDVSRVMTLPSQSSSIQLWVRSIDGTQFADFDNVSVQELHGNHATQPTSASRPTYRTDGTLHWLEFDGVDDHIKPSPWIPKVTEHIYSLAMNPGTVGPTRVMSWIHSDGVILTMSTTGYLRYYTGTSYKVLSEAPPIAGAPHVISTIYSSTHAARIDGAIVDSTADVPGYSGGLGVSIGSDSSYTSMFTDGEFFGAVFVGSASQENLNAVEEYIAAKAGVTLP